MRIGFVGLLAAFALVLAACTASTEPQATTPPPGGDTAAVTEAPAAGGNAANGESLYGAGCIACHGPNGEGIEGLGKPWVDSDFINSSTDTELVTFLIVGRPSDDPLNTTGIGMLPRGGNPSLTDDDLLDLVAYMRTLNT